MQINLRPTFKNICFNGSYFWLMFLCSAQQISTFLTVEIIYNTPDKRYRVICITTFIFKALISVSKSDEIIFDLCNSAIIEF